MAIYHPRIGFRGKDNYDFEVVTAVFDPSNGENDTYLDMEPVYVDNYDASQRTDYGAKFVQVATPSVTFVEVDGSDIDPNKAKRLLRWLTGSRENAWMDVYNRDRKIVCSYLGRFTEVKFQKMDARIIGIRATFTSISPWAFSDVKEVKMKINQGTTTFNIDNDTDDLYSYVYPSMQFKNTYNNGELHVVNTTTNNETIFKNLQQGEVINIDSNFVVYSDNAHRIFNEDFNFEFPKLEPGTNSFTATGNGEVIFKFRYPLKVGDSFLDNYDLKNGVVIYVEDRGTFETKPIAKKHYFLVIKGDLTLNPPNGVNIKVEQSKLYVRGTLTNVNIGSSIGVEKGNLVIVDSSKACPFDELDAKVINGELFIFKDIDRVDIIE